MKTSSGLPMISRRDALAFGLVSVLALPSGANSFDHQHADWSALLRRHVAPFNSGRASRVRYEGMATDRHLLRAYLDSLSSVSTKTFDGFTKAQQLAFLINAYNANTVELILSRYPRLESIKELGTLIQSPWKQKFIPLLDAMVSLDNIEQDMLRAKGRFDEPRIHFAVNCASVGCPMLREEAYVAPRIDAQLDEQTRRFLGDKSRNRYDKSSGTLKVSKIFDWYGDDFKLGTKGSASLTAFFAKFADLLADDATDQAKIKSQKASVSFLDYDWKLNDVSR